MEKLPQSEVINKKRKPDQLPDPFSKRSIKKRRKIINEQSKKICRFYMKTGLCPKDNCPLSHDVQSYLKDRVDALEGPCPLYEAFGLCPNGLTCCWYKSHITEDFKNKANSDPNKVLQIQSEKNVMSTDFLYQLKTGNYVFGEQRPVIQSDTQSLKKVDFKDKLILPALTTFGNLPFRKLVKRFGCDITMSEMVVTGELNHGNTSEWALVKRDPSEDIFGVQICGNKEDSLCKATELLQKVEADFIELNCACPSDFVYKKGMGAQLLDKPNKISALIKAMKTFSDRPIAIKLRTGIEKNTIKEDLLPYLGSWGVSLISIHGRTRIQRYSKEADWQYIKECAAVSEVPVVGLGDIFGYKDYEQALNAGVCAVGVARGALTKPWIFREIKERRDWDISASERLDIIKDFVNFGLMHWGSDYKGITTVRDFLCHHLTFMNKYVPVHCLQKCNLPVSIKNHFDSKCMCYRDQMEELLGSDKIEDILKITEIFLGRTPKDFVFVPKHKSYVKY